MTPQERDMLESLANRIANTPVPQKDPEADALIRERIGSKPDALYVLTQTTLIQEMALNQANQRLHELQEQLDQQRGTQANPEHTSFLGRLFGGTARPAQAPYAPPPPQYAPQGQYAAGYGQPSYGAPQYTQPPGAGSSFLRSAAQTATGVAAGALAFEGIEALLGHHGGWGGGGSFLGGAPNETIVNNYYEEPSSGDDRRNFADTGYDDANSNDATDVNDADYSDANSDDYSAGDGGYDDSGGDVNV